MATHIDANEIPYTAALEIDSHLQVSTTETVDYLLESSVAEVIDRNPSERMLTRLARVVVRLCKGAQALASGLLHRALRRLNHHSLERPKSSIGTSRIESSA